MPSVLAIVSKAIFERDAKIGRKAANVGDVVPLTQYASKNKALAPAGEDGALFLVTVRPPDEQLWLVGILEAPSFDGETWTSPPNAVPIRDITAQKDQIKFVTGAGISAKKGALGMSLQTPRVLSDADVMLLRGSPAVAPPSTSSAAGSNAIPALNAEEKGHLNAHERGGPTPCLCRKCLPNAPEKLTASGVAFVRDRAEAKGIFVWYWLPESLASDRDAIRRAVESRLLGRARDGKKRQYDNLDKTLGARGGRKKPDDDDEEEEDEE